MGDAFDDEVEPTISIGDYLKGVEEQELEADLVLGGDEGKECTYANGYLKRQAIFSCLTCTPDGNAGVCTACSLSCHDGHEIVELWTKRKFRCDCGNSKFGEGYCKLLPNKDVENLENSYNQNFKGLYCTCHRPYPDPEAEEEKEEMIQCCICEDWFHEDHLGLQSPDEQVPRDEEGEPLYEDLICQGCSSLFFFLTLYPQTVKVSAKKQNDSTCSKEKEVAEEVPSTLESSKKPQDGDCVVEASVKDAISGDDKLGNGVLVGASNAVLQASSSAAGPSKVCVVGEDLLKSTLQLEKSETMFLCKNWREVLCRCQNCVELYTLKGISFLLDKEDSIHEYEKIGKRKRDEKLQQQEGQELEYLDKLGHVQKMELLSGIADMKSEMSSFLANFDSSKAITAADVHGVFENLAKKRKRMP